MKVKTALFAKGQKIESDIELWHKWFIHVNFPRLLEMQMKNIVFSLPRFSGQNGHVCEACQLGKQHRLPFCNEHNQSQNPLDVIHSDVWGTTQNVSIEGSRYFLTFVDDCTRHTWTCLIDFLEGEEPYEFPEVRGGKEYFSD